ncbi:uncharacterized protein AB9W97_014088 [Spinachia spinachia]
MKLLRWSAMLLCLCFNAETSAVWRESGDNVTLRCSSSDERYDGMYLYLYQEHMTQVQVVYYPGPQHNIVTAGARFRGRIHTDGSLRNNTVTISKLTVNDTGFYKCVYLQFGSDETPCSDYTLFVRGVAPCSCLLTHGKSPCLVWIIIAAFITGTLVTLSFIPLVVSRVRRWSSSRTTAAPRQVSNDNVYEVMNPG